MHKVLVLAMAMLCGCSVGPTRISEHYRSLTAMFGPDIEMIDDVFDDFSTLWMVQTTNAVFTLRVKNPSNGTAMSYNVVHVYFGKTVDLTKYQVKVNN